MGRTLQGMPFALRVHLKIPLYKAMARRLLVSPRIFGCCLMLSESVQVSTFELLPHNLVDMDMMAVHQPVKQTQRSRY